MRKINAREWAIKFNNNIDLTPGDGQMIVTATITKDRLREVLEAKGITMSDSKFKNTKLANLKAMILDELLEKEVGYEN